jgi:hypothetical protein
MSVFQKDFLERLARGRVSQESRETPPPKTVSAEQTALKVEAAIKQQRIEQRKEGWRASAKWLEQNCEEFRQQGNGEVSNATNGTSSLVSCSNSGEPANERPTVESHPLVGEPGSPQSAHEALSAPPSIPPLPASWWQGFLYGSPDAILSSRDANVALCLVAEKLNLPVGNSEPIERIRAGELRKMLRDRFGPMEAEQTMVALWRSAPPSPGAPQVAADQSQLVPGLLPANRRWIRDLHDPDRIEREWLLDHGIGL